MTPPDRFEPDFIDRMDLRTKAGKAVRARVHALAQSLGGADNLSYQRMSLVQRVIHLEFLLEKREEEIAQIEGKVDTALMGQYVQGINGLIGLFRILGLERQARDVTLGDYVRAKESSG